MLMKRFYMIILASMILALLPCMAFIAYGASDLPSYTVRYIGPGSPSAINNNGIIAGAALNGNNYDPLFSIGGRQWEPLPEPAGAMSTFPTDINDAGVIVGVSYSTSWVPSAVRWSPSGSGYVIDVLPKLPGDTASYATGINNLGQIVGARNALGYVPTGTGWLYSDVEGLAGLSERYGLWTVPSDINDSGKIISGVELLDIVTGTTVVTGNSGPSNYNPVSSVAINNDGMIAGYASLRSTSLNIRSVFRYEGEAGWRFIAGSSKYTAASDINGRGDITYGELGAGIYLDALGTFAISSLLDPTETAAGWVVTGTAPKINDSRMIAMTATNTSSGIAGCVLLTPTGTLDVPTAPDRFVGVAHAASQMEPYDSIELSWRNTSSLTRSYDLERRLAGNTAWTRLSLVPPGTGTVHSDTGVEAGATYEYRVRAVGLSGPGAWSETIIVAAPAEPMDTIPPSVSITSPANGATVSGIVRVTAVAADNVAMEYLEISYWDQYLGKRIVLGSSSGTGSLAVDWDTSKLTPAVYELTAYATDRVGNWSNTSITVNAGAVYKTMKVSGISLSAARSGSKVNVTGTVSILDDKGKALPSASVSVKWTQPGGVVKEQAALTNSRGQVKFSTTGIKGTYTLTIMNVQKSGYVFNIDGSILTKSIVKN